MVFYYIFILYTTSIASFEIITIQSVNVVMNVVTEIRTLNIIYPFNNNLTFFWWDFFWFYMVLYSNITYQYYTCSSH